MADAPVPHRIERTKNRHSRAVYKDGHVIIRLARNLSSFEEREHIDYLLRRMTTLVAKERERTSIEPFKAILDGAAEAVVTLADDSRYQFVLTPGKKNRLKKIAGGWQLTISPAVRRRSLHRTLWNLVAQAALPRIDTLVRQVDRETFDFGVRRVRLGYASSQWGSCSRDGNVMLNSVLLFVPAHLLRYVIIHELAHRKHKDHSKKFWNLVESVLPAYKEHRSELRKYRITPL